MSLDAQGRRCYPTPGPVAQLVEQRTFNPTVRGSSPRGLTVKSSVFNGLHGHLQIIRIRLIEFGTSSELRELDTADAAQRTFWRVSSRESLGVPEGPLGDGALRDEPSQLYMDRLCYSATIERSRDQALAGIGPGAETSMFKLYLSELGWIGKVLGRRAAQSMDAKREQHHRE